MLQLNHDRENKFYYFKHNVCISQELENRKPTEAGQKHFAYKKVSICFSRKALSLLRFMQLLLHKKIRRKICIWSNLLLEILDGKLHLLCSISMNSLIILLCQVVGWKRVGDVSNYRKRE